MNFSCNYVLELQGLHHQFHGIPQEPALQDVAIEELVEDISQWSVTKIFISLKTERGGEVKEGGSTGKKERSKLLSSLHLVAIKPTPKSVICRHQFKHKSFNFLHPTATQPIPISVIDLHLDSHSFSKFFASAKTFIAESVSATAFDKLISTNPVQLVTKFDNPTFENNLDRDKSMERSVVFQALDTEIRKESSTCGQRERSSFEMEGKRWNILRIRSERSGLRDFRWSDSAA